MSIYSETDPTVVSRNYTSRTEQFWWNSLVRTVQNYKTSLAPHEHCRSKQFFRTRREPQGYVPYIEYHRNWKKALRTRVGNSDNIGVFLKLTNTYLLVGGEEENTESFRRMVEGDIPNTPIINSSIAGCRIIGCMCVGNKYGLIVPESTTDTELEHLQEDLPDSVEVKKLEERLSALGNVIVCNDRVALIHPDLDKESQEIVENTLQVETFRYAITTNPLVGSYCVLNSYGGLVPKDTSNSAIEDLSSLLDKPIVMGTVNSGNLNLGSGLIANDSIAYAGMKTTHQEFLSIEAAFNLT